MKNLLKKIFYTKFIIEVIGELDFPCCTHIYLRHLPTNNCEINYYDLKNDTWYYLSVESTEMTIKNGKLIHSIQVDVKK